MTEEKLQEYVRLSRLDGYDKHYDTVDDAVEMMEEIVDELVAEVRRLQKIVLERWAEFTV